MPHTTKNPGRDRAVLLGLLALAVFATPETSWWLGASPPWYLPYLLWLAVIVLAAWQSRAERRQGQPDDD
jgi:hypothetical protein